MPRPQWHARIDVADPRSGGSGFLVDNRHVLTCAHVVSEHDAATVSFVGTQHVDLPAVVQQCNWEWRSGGPDVALLRLAEPVPLIPAVLASFSAVEIFSEHDLNAFGFPGGHVQAGIISGFRAKPARLGNGVCQLKSIDDVEVPLERGFSGAAVYVDGSYEVLGMVTSSDLRGGDGRVGAMLPLEEIAVFWPPLADLVGLGPFSPAEYRSLRAALEPIRTPVADVTRLYAEAFSRWEGLQPAASPALSSVLAVAEALATVTHCPVGDVRRLVADLLYLVAREHPEAKTAILAWMDRHLFAHSGGRFGGGWPGVESGPVAESDGGAAGRSWIVVRIAPTARSRETRQLTIWTAARAESGLDAPVFDDPVSEAELQQTVERYLPEALSRLPRKRPVTVEFVLPRGLLSMPVDEWRTQPQHRVMLGWRWPVVVRDLTWFYEPEPRELEERANALGELDGTLDAVMRWRHCRSPESMAGFDAWLWGEEYPLVLGLTGPWASDERIDSAVANGVPVLLWQRSPCPDDHLDPANPCFGVELHSTAERKLHGVAVDALPEKVRLLRARLGGDGTGCGVSLLWYDRRRPTPPPLEFAE
ncbi:trypsin-like peptidase domain-containing protein [Plantactinospora sp. WMMB782]|uniref:VMAP-C domain-containing protein n=1 Tax=Plantactinospora sp. WMMB782 TaxID=3404121 RepID=UPI003B939C3C